MVTTQAISVEQFRDEAKDFLDTHAKPIDRSLGAWGEGSDAVAAYAVKSPERERADLDAARGWQRRKFDAGFGWITGPPEYGGRGLAAGYERAYARLEAGYAVPPQVMLGGGLGVVAPTVLHHGPAWMKKEYLAGFYR